MFFMVKFSIYKLFFQYIDIKNSLYVCISKYLAKTYSNKRDELQRRGPVEGSSKELHSLPRLDMVI